MANLKSKSRIKLLLFRLRTNSASLESRNGRVTTNKIGASEISGTTETRRSRAARNRESRLKKWWFRKSN